MAEDDCHEKFIDRAVKNFRQRWATLDIPDRVKLPNREKSSVEAGRHGMKFVVVRDFDGKPLAYYKIYRNGRLRHSEQRPPTPLPIQLRRGYRTGRGPRRKT